MRMMKMRRVKGRNMPGRGTVRKGRCAEAEEEASRCGAVEEEDRKWREEEEETNQKMVVSYVD